MKGTNQEQSCLRASAGALGEGPEPDLLAALPESTGVFPLSQAQESVWVVEQMVPGSGAYNIPEGWRLRGHLHLEALQWSLEQILRRHEALRTVFGVQEGKPVQIILPPGPFVLHTIDLRLRAAREVEVEQLMGAEARRPFDLAHGPLLRVTLFRLAEQEYVMVVNMHHLVSDAWSQGVFMRELVQLYSARVAGKPALLSELPIQFADVVMWQRGSEQEPVVQQALSYWEKQLQSCPPLDFPTDYARPGTQSFRGATLFFTLPQELVDAVKDLSRRQGTTWFMTLLTAYQVLLQRYSRQEDIVVGSPFAGREQIEAEGLIGFFVNTHALRTDLSGDPPFVELLGRVREVVLGANTHQEVPLERLMKLLQPDRDLGRHPLFQTVFGQQTTLAEAWRLPELELSRLELDNGAAKFDLTLLLSESSQGLRVRCEYSTDLFKAGTVARLMRQYQTLLEGIVTAPQKRLSELPLLTSVERQQLLVSWNQTAQAYERDRCVHELFEAQGARTPEAIALKFAGRQMTYGELNGRANQLAWRLRACGVGPDLLVGLCLERSLELVVAMLAILKAGGAYLPLDRTYPKERLAFMLEDAGAPVLVTDSGFEVSGMPLSPERIIYVDAEQGTLAQESAEKPPNVVRAVNLAYVIYTSGSSGTPKGVQIPHRGVVRLVRNTHYAELLSTDTFLQLAPISFDASTFEIWGALLNGARLVIFPPHVPSLEELSRTLLQEQISTLWLTAGLFHQMIDQHLDSLRGLRQLLAGGDVLSVPHVVRAVRELSGCRLINGYGPTENTTFTCCYPVPGCWPGGRSVPIGRPISNTEVYVLDEHLEPVPVGVPGELFTGGDGLARGYLKRPELSASKFVPNPFRPGTEPEVLFRTGDLVRWLPDGALEFLGRMDEQLKIRGFRIEPGEIEVSLTRHPAVDQAVVIARPDGSGSKHLVGYVVPKAGKSILQDELREFLQGKLPPYMQPSELVVLEQLPLTPNGKVDRRALPTPDLEEVAEEEPPRNATEELLIAIWREVLERQSVGIHQNFFHLGGHSLLATQVVSRIARALHVELPVGVIFEAPTVARLAEAVRAIQQAAQSSLPSIPRQVSSTRAAELLTQLDQLSDAEVEQLLQDPEVKNLLS